MTNKENRTFIQKISSTFPLLRKLGLAYVTISAGMFMFGFVSTLIVKLA
ncbi:hypothetical protein IOQ59_08220 [Pontibacterium sp. N1Y112]|uniref:Uncharacterized protein n=1 Tax=Pontibacterium sinense TaxID=2781979 RepID=A0A8J7FJD0_9GAMM|nr:hypothetical protein [Pontibacterium sinense]MBE9397243.1 hypothetical protein [Pontibacterium sinense]